MEETDIKSRQLDSHTTNSLRLSSVSDTLGSFEGFVDALTIWINKPHVVNRRLCGSRINHQTRVTNLHDSEVLVHKLIRNHRYMVPPLITEHRTFYNFVSHDSERNDFHSADKSVIVANRSTSPDISGSDLVNYNTLKGVSENACLSNDTAEDALNYSKNTVTGNVVDHSNIIHTSVHCEAADPLNIGKTEELLGGESGSLSHEIDPLWQTEDDKYSIILRELLPKQPERHSNMPELILLDRDRQSCTFYPLVSSSSVDIPIEVIYEFIYKPGSKNRIELYVSKTDQSRDSKRKLSLTWLKDVLLKKLSRWSETPNLKTSLTSLVLVPVDEYSRLYSELKNKYGLHFAKIWPENTDPQKFVFEDVSIATYLLLLWKQDRIKKGLSRKQSFVDLGCGNGLLVHILASEGHPGYGVDIRKRKIWDLYGADTILKESTVTPSSDCLFPESDWLIGNHSDELTPWIPVMAARSAYTCNYFVLPCCHYDFHAKFSYDPEFGKATDGQYQCYLNYVRHVGEECGFNVEEDVLRIPSTKRVCFIGRTRSYDKSCEFEMDQSRQDFIERRCGPAAINDCQSNDCTTSNTTLTDQWVQNFTPRDKVETVRNCVTVSECVKNKVIETVFNTILDSSDCEVRTGHDGNPWRKGGFVPINKVCDLFDKLTLSELKNECGGLQTLLRNCSQVFQVSSGNVQLRDFTQENPFEGRKKTGKPSNKGDFHKTSICWFYTNHPDGCPKPADTCMYAHGVTELREKPTREKKK